MPFRRFAVAESSMSPSFTEGEYLVTRQRSPRPGEVVVFEHPDRPGFHLLKRVIAVAGEVVEIAGGVVSVDGRAEALGVADHAGSDGTWSVPSGHIFVLGDARHRSVDDSRTLGPVNIGAKGNVVVFRYWPFARVGRIRRF